MKTQPSGNLPPPNATGPRPITAADRKAQGTAKRKPRTTATATVKVTATASNDGKKARVRKNAAASAVVPAAKVAPVLPTVISTKQSAQVPWWKKLLVWLGIGNNNVQPATASTATQTTTNAPAAGRTVPPTAHPRAAALAPNTTAAIHGRPAARTATTATKEKMSWWKLVLATLFLLFAIIFLIGSVAGLVDNLKSLRPKTPAITRVGGNTIAPAVVATPKAATPPAIQLIASSSTNEPSKSVAKIKSEFPEINGIKGDNNDHNNVIMIGNVTLGSYNGTPSSAARTAVGNVTNAVASAVNAAGQLPPGCTSLVEVTASAEMLANTANNSIRLDPVSMKTGDYIHVSVPSGWRAAIWSSSLNVYVTRDGKLDELRADYNPNDEREIALTREFYFWLKPGTSYSRLDIGFIRYPR